MVGNLRAAVVRRLSGKADDEPTKRIDYRAVTRRVRWRAVFSRFEGHWAYLENARRLFPETYGRLIRHFRAWWIHVDPTAGHPRFVAANAPTSPPAASLGPVAGATAARRYVEMLEDVFDLCRYHDILQQAPHGQACAYKEMGKCPAPCDGSITMDAYRDQIDRAIRFVDPPHEPWLAEQTARMKAAAAELNFERAGRIKTRIERARTATAPGYEHFASLERFGYLVLQHGDGKRKVRPFIVAPGVIDFPGEMKPKALDQQIEYLAEYAKHLWQRPTVEMDRPAVERTNLVAWHLLRGKREPGIFIHADDCTDDRIAAAIEELTTRKKTESDDPDGVEQVMESGSKRE